MLFLSAVIAILVLIDPCIIAILIVATMVRIQECTAVKICKLFLHPAEMAGALRSAHLIVLLSTPKTAISTQSDPTNDTSCYGSSLRSHRFR